MYSFDKEKYIFESRQKLWLYSSYYLIVSILISYIFYYYDLRKVSVPDEIVISGILINIFFSYLILNTAEKIKKHAKKFDINLSSIKSIKLYDKIVFYSIIINCIYTISTAVIYKQKNYLRKLNTIVVAILFAVIWFNYHFLY